MMSLPAAQVGVVDAGDDVGADEHEQIVVALEIARMAS